MATSSKDHVDKDAAAVYEYLCRLEEAKKWIEAVLMETLPPATELVDCLPNGVLLCALGKKLLPNDPMWKKVYDPDQAKFKAKGLEYRHTDNVNFWLAALNKLGLPRFFLPSVEDIYHKKNIPRLIYSIHALSYFLKKQHLIGYTVEDIFKGKPTFSNEEISHTSQNLSKVDTLPSFNSLAALVEEELQYKVLGLVESMQGDEGKQESGSQELLPPTPEFDDPQYIPLSAALTKEVMAAVHEMPHLPLLRLPCKTAGTYVSMYAKKPFVMGKNGLNSDVERALEKINVALEKGDVQGAFEGLESKALNLPFVFKDPHTYFTALMEEQRKGIPNNVLCVYSGMSRESCEAILGVQSSGAYLIRENKAEPGTIIFSLRNQGGVKHWKMMNDNGYYLWSGAKCLFDEFIEHTLVSLSNAAKIYTFPAVSISLQMVVDSEDEKAVKVLEGLRHDRRLTYGQLFSVVRAVNSDIRRSRKAPSSDVDLSQPKYPSWDRSKVVSMSRSDAESILTKEGVPGSFLLRTSDTSPGDFALAFRTAKEVRHWKLVCKGQKYFVHPRPNPYNSLEDIVAHFQEAVSQETKLVMTPLEPRTGKLPDKLTPMSEKLNVDVPEKAPEEKALAERVPERSEQVVPERPEKVVPERPDRIVPERPERVVPERPERVVPERPERVVPERPERVVPERPERVVPERPDRIVPERPERVVPERPERVVPERPDRIVPERPERLLEIPDRQHVQMLSPTSPMAGPFVGPTPSLSKLNPANLTSWTVDDVCQWLLEQDFGQYIETFRYNAIDGECMLTLDNELLKTDLGVTALGHRTRMLRRLNELKTHGR